MGCRTFKDCMSTKHYFDYALIPHLAVFPSDDSWGKQYSSSCNKCDCFDGKISCTKKKCADCEAGKMCESSTHCGANGECKFEAEMSATLEQIGWIGWA